MKKIKSVSAHIGPSEESELLHNNRIIISENIDKTRSDCNKYFVFSNGTNNEGLRNLSLEESYELIFSKSYKAFQNKQRPCRRSEALNYLEHIRLQKIKEKKAGKNYKSKKTNEMYTIIFQIGNKSDTSYSSNESDFFTSKKILEEVAKKILELPYVITLDSENSKDFKMPDTPAVILVQNCCTHFDEEGAGHLTLNIIPIFNQAKRGMTTVNNAKACWSALGFETKYETLNEINKIHEEKSQIDGNKKVFVKRGALDWMEFVKTNIIEPEMEKYDWYRAEKLERPEFEKHLNIHEYKVQMRKKELDKLNEDISSADIEKAIKEVDSTLAFYDSEKHYSENFKNNTDRSKEFAEYNVISTEFWNWYKNEKDIVLEELQNLKDEERYMYLKIQHYNNLLIRSSSLLSKMFNFIFKHFYLLRKKQYDLKIEELIRNRDELKLISKIFSSDSYKVRNDLMDKNKNPNVEFLNALKSLETQLKDDYEKLLEKELNMKIEK